MVDERWCVSVHDVRRQCIDRSRGRRTNEESCGELSLFTSCSSTVSTSPLLASSAVDLVMMSTNRHIASFISARGVGVGRVGRYVVDVY